MAGKRTFTDEAPEGWKTCTKCRNEKPLAHFHLHRLSPDGRQYICKACVHAGKRKVAPRPKKVLRNGLTIKDYDKMLASQGGRCAICRALPGKRRFPVDHNHDTGKRRGVLCDNCNVGIARLGEDVGRMMAAISYLNRTA